MTREEFDALKEGDVIRQIVGSGQGYIVTENYGKWKIVVRTITATNPEEWELAVDKQT